MKIGGANLRLTSLGEDAVSVTAVRGREGLSRPYRFDIDVRTDVDLLALDPTLLGSAATLHWSADDAAPIVTQGILSALTACGIDRQGKRSYRLRLAPRLALLRRRKNSRIFQNSPVVDIITQVLDGHAIPKIWNLTKKYPVREYCVQYQETDYEFLTRLCAEAGIFYYFLHPNLEDLSRADSPDKLTEHIVFGDDVRHYPPLLDPANTGAALRIPFAQARGGGAIGGGDYVNEFDYRRAIRSQSVTLRDYDFTRPMLDLHAGLHEEDDAKGAQQKAFGESLAQTFGPLEVYEHHAEYGETDVSRAHADMLLEGQRARAIVAKGAGTCRRFTPGVRFGLEQHPVEGLDGREYTIVTVQHVYSFKEELEAYSNTFECIPASTLYRPKRKPRSLSQVLETAKVVGPVGETVYTDALGRIKVQFFWDRDGSNNEHSSCFIRVAQPWAGTSWGVQFIPRIGDEVLVSFLGGDEDRPMVMGSVYNATHPPPFPLPVSKSKSGIRTQSIGGPGSNELSFEDGAGAELLHVRAARDLREVAGNDHIVEAANDQTTIVAKSQRVTVGQTRTVSVAGDENHSIAGMESHVVGGNQIINVSGYRRETITGSANSELHGENIENHGHESRVIEGHLSTTVGTEEHPTGMDVLVYGHENHAATKSLTLRADSRISIHCGETSITILPESIRIESKKIVLKAKEDLILLGDGPGIEISKEIDILGNTIKMFSQGGSVELDASAAHVDGPLVKLNCGAGSAPSIDDQEDHPDQKPFKWRCLDANLKPYKGKTYRLAAMGVRFKGTTDDDGFVAELIPEDAEVADLTVWIEEYPEGRRMHRTIRLEELPPSTSALGASIRLANLGYYTGHDTDHLTPELTVALREFQHDYKLDETGEVDGATADKLDEVHPG